MFQVDHKTVFQSFHDRFIQLSDIHGNSIRQKIILVYFKLPIKKTIGKELASLSQRVQSMKRNRQFA